MAIDDEGRLPPPRKALGEILGEGRVGNRERILGIENQCP
jgi:hypothetical protein